VHCLQRRLVKEVVVAEHGRLFQRCGGSQRSPAAAVALGLKVQVQLDARFVTKQVQIEACFAHQLDRAGPRVQLLCRPNRTQQLRDHGLGP
jgi:hypothetical protein